MYFVFFIQRKLMNKQWYMFIVPVYEKMHCLVVCFYYSSREKLIVLRYGLDCSASEKLFCYHNLTSFIGICLVSPVKAAPGGALKKKELMNAMQPHISA